MWRLQTWALGQEALLCWQRRSQGRELDFQRHVPRGLGPEQAALTPVRTPAASISNYIHPRTKGAGGFPMCLACPGPHCRLLDAFLLVAFSPLPNSIGGNPSHLLGHLVKTCPCIHTIFPDPHGVSFSRVFPQIPTLSLSRRPLYGSDVTESDGILSYIWLQLNLPLRVSENRKGSEAQS